MASMAARAERNREARQRLADALLLVSKRLNIPLPEEGRRMRDPDLQPIVEIERFAEFVESVDVALGGLSAEGEVPGGYDTWTVAMLRAEIAKRGLKTGGAQSKADLAFVLEKDDAAPDEEPEDDESDGDAFEDES
jgi:hypothetical protein